MRSISSVARILWKYIFYFLLLHPKFHLYSRYLRIVCWYCNDFLLLLPKPSITNCSSMSLQWEFIECYQYIQLLLQTFKNLLMDNLPTIHRVQDHSLLSLWEQWCIYSFTCPLDSWLAANLKSTTFHPIKRTLEGSFNRVKSNRFQVSCQSAV